MSTAGYTFAEACAMLGVSAHTLRKRIHAGVIHAERVERPQGYAWTVFLERSVVTAAGTAGSEVTTDEPAAVTTNEPAASAQNRRLPPDGHQLAIALAPLIETAVNAAVAPLRAELADVRALLTAHDQELGAVRLERDQLAEQVRALKEPTSQIRPQTGPTDGVAVQPTQTAPETPRARPWWRFWRA